jgi:murein DD-endopeptidase MepM/ murein hydrolase activator NlpD
VTALLIADSPLAPRPLPLSAADIPPLGLYLPSFDQAGVLAFELRPEPALPPTDNRLLSANEDFPIISDAVGAAAIRAYGGEDCAPSGYPVSGLLTQRFYGYHTGIDIGVPIGTPVQATHSADVLFAGWNAYGYGFLVILQNGKYITYYAHLTNFNVQTGDRLGAGSIIGWSGSTGNSTGPHLHYETRIGDVAVDPLTFGTRGLDSC